jgi:hypothetical protein
MNAIPFPDASQLAAPVTEAELRGFLGDARFEAWRPKLRAACRLAGSGGYWFDLTDHVLTLPADREGAARALYAALREGR